MGSRYTIVCHTVDLIVIASVVPDNKKPRTSVVPEVLQKL